MGRHRATKQRPCISTGRRRYLNTSIHYYPIMTLPAGIVNRNCQMFFPSSAGPTETGARREAPNYYNCDRISIFAVFPLMTHCDPLHHGVSGRDYGGRRIRWTAQNNRIYNRATVLQPFASEPGPGCRANAFRQKCVIMTR